ncbi:MAG: Omp28-related outer membrane protein [Saprospiraceae bacterium]
MKFLSFIILIYISICSCSEIPVVLPVNDPNSGNNIDQNVLVEEYTGVRCQNCPAGAQLLEELKTIHGNRLTILSIHGGFFAQPTNRENKLTLDNSFGRQLISVFNQPQGYPSAMINRKLFNGQSSLFLGGSFWPGYINQEKSKIPQLGMTIRNTLDTNSRVLTVEVSINGLVDLNPQPLMLSVALSENNIKDAQLTPIGIDINYVHQHVMRTFLGNVLGNTIDPITLNQSKSYSFSLVIPIAWALNQLQVVAFVHKTRPDNEVIQVVEKKLL